MISRLVVVFTFFIIPLSALADETVQLSTVSRSQFSTSIVDREPIDSVESLGLETNKLYFFTEMKNYSGEQIVHQWIYNGQIMAEVPLSISGVRWRTYSSKNFQNDWSGDWKVNVINSDGKVILSSGFSYGTDSTLPLQSTPIITSEPDEIAMEASAPAVDSAPPSRSTSKPIGTPGRATHSKKQTSIRTRTTRDYSTGGGEVVDKVSELLATREKVLSVLFRVGSMTLDYDQVDRIDSIVERLRTLDTEQYLIRIEGMASPEGNFGSNVKLSLGRAESVWKYLIIGQAISPEALFMTGLGPVNASKSDYDNLRRADIILYRMVVDFDDSMDVTNTGN